MGSDGAAYFERKEDDYMDFEMENICEDEEECSLDCDSEPGICKSFHKAYDFKDYEDKGYKLTDTTGAGDSFTGAFAVALLEGMTVQQAL